MNVNQLRGLMVDTLDEYMYDYSDQRILFFHTFPGSGKTFTTTKFMQENEFLVIYTFPTHPLGKEAVVDPYGVLQIKSRRYFCNDSRFKKIEKFGIDAKILCDNFCPDKDTCEYYLRLKELFEYPQSWCGVHHHLSNLVQSYIEQHGECVDAIVIDEEFLQSLYVNVAIDMKLLRWTIQLLSNFYDSPEKILITYLLKEITYGMQTGRTNEIDFDQVKNDILEYGDRYRFKNMYGFLREVDETLLEWFIQGRTIKFNVLRPLLEMAKNYYYNRDKRGYLESMLNLGYSKRRDKYYAFLHRYDLDCVRLDNQKIIVLDATTPTAIYERVFNREINLLEYGKTDDAKVYQFNGYPTRNRFPMSSLVSRVNNEVKFTKGFDRLCNIVKGICDKHKNERILIVSRKKFGIKERIADYLKKGGISVQISRLGLELGPERVSVEHFGGLRGVNKYKDGFSVCIIFGTPFPNPEFIKRQSILLGIDREELVELAREMEIIQDLYRIRPYGKDNAYFYVLTSIDLGFVIEGRMSPKQMENWIFGRKPKIRDNAVLRSRIKGDILDAFRKWDVLKKSEVREKVSGRDVTVDEIFSELRDEGFFERVKIENAGRGRKPEKYRLKWDVLRDLDKAP